MTPELAKNIRVGSGLPCKTGAEVADHYRERLREQGIGPSPSYASELLLRIPVH